MEAKLKKKNYSLNKSFFLKFFYENIILLGPIIENKDPFFNLIKFDSEISEIFLNKINSETTKFLYFNKTSINEILYK